MCCIYPGDDITEKNMEVFMMMVAKLLRYGHYEYFCRMASIISVLTLTMNFLRSDPIPLWM